jgi:orotidine-5'-phosphate decarboxylase
MSVRERIALAADVPLQQALRVYTEVAPYVGVAKVGLSLFVEHGPQAVRAFQEAGAEVFLDLKLHDIPNTVRLAAAQAAELRVRYLTVHALGGPSMLTAAREGAEAGAKKANVPAPTLLAVTVLTSHSPEEVAKLGLRGQPEEVARALARLAQGAGIEGLVCSPREAATLRAAMGPKAILCTPGIRPGGAGGDDQARAETPTFAIEAGADLLVVGRPIYAAADAKAAARAIHDEIARAAP